MAAVVSTGKNDSSGKPVYAAVPYKLTVGTGTISKTEGPIEGSGGQLEVFVKFYAWADDDQMPIKVVVERWKFKEP